MNNTTNELEITVTVNGQTFTDTVPVRMHAADYIRHTLGLTGTHVGCEQGVCGMCTLEVDGTVVKSCLLLAVQLDGAAVRTVEALSDADCLSALQEAFRRNHALQCGFCTSAFLAIAKSLEQRDKPIAESDIRDEISGVLCRCTGYEGIVQAIADYLESIGKMQNIPEMSS